MHIRYSSSVHDGRDFTTVKLGSVHSFPCEFVLDKEVAPYVLPEGDQRKQLVKHQVRDRSGGRHESHSFLGGARLDGGYPSPCHENHHGAAPKLAQKTF